MSLKSMTAPKRIFSATLLSCLVFASILITQPQEGDKAQAPSNPGQPQIGIQSRNYDSRGNVSSRSDKPAAAVSSIMPVKPSAEAKPAKPVKPTVDFTYTVKQGDTLFDLAVTYGVTVDNIMIANGLDSDRLSLAQKLLIPVSGKIKAIKTVDQAPPKLIKPAHQTSKSDVSRARYNGRAVGQLIKWSEARKIYAIGDVANVIDVKTGYTFKIKRKGGHNHADCEPLTTVDTAVMKKIYGSWSWVRRAIVVEIEGKKIAASMAGMPHGSNNITDNGFSGHFDVHFLGSMTHGSEYTKSRVPLVDADHQAMVKKAAGQ